MIQLLHVLTFNLRSHDKLYRYGGDEFAILAHAVDKNGAAPLARKLCKSAEKERFSGAGVGDSQVTISIGAASLPQNAVTKEGLIKAADEALYQAKKTGRNRFYLSGFC